MGWQGLRLVAKHSDGSAATGRVQVWFMSRVLF